MTSSGGKIAPSELEPAGATAAEAVRGRATGGPIPWVPGTKFAVNQLATINGATIICLVAHTAGETFSGLGTNWALVSGLAGIEKALGNVSGAVTLDFSVATAFSFTMTGNTTLKPTNLPQYSKGDILWPLQDSVGGHTWSIESATWLGSTPEPTFALRKEELNGIAYATKAGKLYCAVVGGTL